MVCTFFGHHDCPSEIAEDLRNIIVGLIIKHGVTDFYVGNEGRFDRLVYRTLKEISKEYPQIRYSVVLAYMPEKGGKDSDAFYNDTIIPDKLEKVPPRYAICRRNLWMIEQADVVVTYVRHISNGAYKYQQIAEKKGKEVIGI